MLATGYRTLRRIAASAMSEVYLARQISLGRDVAIKMMNAAAAADLVERGRFAREARTQAALAHPSIVPVYELADGGPVPSFVMPYVAGGSLEGWTGQGGWQARRNVARVCGLLADIAEALDAAHRAGVVHRDVKPANILIDAATGRGMLTDFGVVIVATSDQSRSEVSLAMGTPGYMAPEQILRDPEATGLGDIYSLGVVAFELFAGRLPYTGASAEVVAARQASQAAPPLEAFAARIPRAVAAVVNRCLARRPAKRWQDGASLAAALREAAAARRRSFSGALAGLRSAVALF